MIIGIVGLPGSGKTYFAVRRLYRSALENPSRLIVSNVRSLWFPFPARIRYVDSLEECFSLRDCLLFLDEVHIWFSSRDYRSHGRIYDAWVSQLRKSNVDLLYTSQALMGVEKLLRDRTDMIYCVSSFFRLGFFTFRSYWGAPPPERRRRMRPATLGFYIFNPLIASCYDTRDTIASAVPL